MNGTKTAMNKKLLSLVVVLVICVAALVTVAYAYNANYKDTVNGSDVVPEENSKYIYITGKGLNYPGEDVYAEFDVKYTTTETTVDSDGNNVITTYPDRYTLVSLDDGNDPSDISMVNGIATIKLGVVEIINKDTKADSVTLLASDLSDVKNEDKSIFKNNLTTENIKFKVSGGSYGNIFSFTDNKVEVEVYLVAEVDTEPSKEKFNSDEMRYVDPKTGKLYLETDSEGNPIFDDFGTLETTLAVPGFTLTLSASDDSEPISKVGTVTADEIKAVQEMAKVNSDIELKVSDSNGASIVLNNIAIASLDADTPVSLTVTEVTSGVPAGVTKAYEVDFSGYHFGQTGAELTISIPYDGDATDDVSVAYIESGAVVCVYEASVIDGKIVFTTSHLSTYGVMTGYDAVASVEIDGITEMYTSFADAIASIEGADATITLLEDIDAVADQVKTRDVFGSGPYPDSIVLDGNGHSITLGTYSSEAGADHSYDMLCFNQVRSVVLDGLTIIGNESAGFYTGSSQVLIVNCEFKGTFKNDSNNWTGTDGCPVDICCQVDNFTILYDNDSKYVYYWYYPADNIISGSVNGVDVSNGMAKIGDKGYKTLADAFSEAKSGDTIVLLRDIDAVADQVKTRDVFGSGPYPSEITFDGNGHSLTLGTYSSEAGADHSYDMLCFNQVGSLIIENLTVIGNESAGIYAVANDVVICECSFSGTFKNDSNKWTGTDGRPVDIYCQASGFDIEYDCDDSEVYIWYPSAVAVNGTVNGIAFTNGSVKIGDTGYMTLADAISAAKTGDEISLIESVRYDVSKDGANLFSTKAVTINGNGFGITMLNDTTSAVDVCSGMTFNKVAFQIESANSVTGNVFDITCSSSKTIAFNDCMFNITGTEGDYGEVISKCTTDSGRINFFQLGDFKGSFTLKNCEFSYYTEQVNRVARVVLTDSSSLVTITGCKVFTSCTDVSEFKVTASGFELASSNYDMTSTSTLTFGTTHGTDTGALLYYVGSSA